MQHARSKGRYQVREAQGAADLRQVLRLRALCFRGDADAQDGDAFDGTCDHLMVEEGATGALVACFRLLFLRDGSGIDASYAAQFYDLSALAHYAEPMVEVGRFCIHPDWQDADILRTAWGGITRYVDERRVRMLFGCSSFAGTDTGPYGETFAALASGHLAPDRWRPRPKAHLIHAFSVERAQKGADARRALAQMPPLLRTYLAMGGWVSDHAVIDADLGTIHVFTGVEVSAIPPARKKALRAIAG